MTLIRANVPRKPTKSTEWVDPVFEALGSNIRRDILEMLHFAGGSLTSKVIADYFGISWQAISRHLRLLTEAGLVSCEILGRDHVYTLEREWLQRVAGEWITKVASKGTILPDGTLVFSDASRHSK
jgi:DNA-binding transcriptional ArsR family regulator